MAKDQTIYDWTNTESQETGDLVSTRLPDIDSFYML